MNTPETEVKQVGGDDAAYADGCAWIAGEYVPIARAAIPILDTGFVRSDLTYDVVSVWQGRFFRLEDHLDRLWTGCARIQLEPPIDREQMREVIVETVRRSALYEAYVEAIVTRGIPPRGGRDPREFDARFYAFAIPYVWILRPEQQEIGADVVVARNTIRIPPESVDPTVKNFHWGDMTRALFEAYARGASLPVLTDGNGNVTEGPGVNVFAVIAHRLHTPDRGVLEGITRKTVLEMARELGLDTIVDVMPERTLKRAEEVFLTSTAGGILPVRTLDGQQVGDGRPGPITRQLSKRYWQLHDDPRYTLEVSYSRS
jgi:branched-chain amino acid aminotransferase